MAYDHNLRQKKNAKKAAEETFEPKSKRDERILLSHASKSTWLATFGILIVMAIAYSVINHFGTKGVKSSEKAEKSQQIFDQQLATVAEEQPIESVAKAVESETEVVEVEVVADEKSPEESLKASSAEGSQLIQANALPLPEGALDKPKMTFYDEMQQLEVPLDDAKKYPILLEVPEYIVAGSFFNESSARKELGRLASYGQELIMVASQGSSGRTVYVLKTKAYANRKELGVRKNELRELGARVRSYPVKNQ